MTRAFQRTRFRAVWGTIGRGKYLNGHCFPVFFRLWAVFATKTFSIWARFLSVLDEHHHKFSAQSEYRVNTYGGAKKSQKKVEWSYLWSVAPRYAPLYFFLGPHSRSHTRSSFFWFFFLRNIVIFLVIFFFTVINF